MAATGTAAPHAKPSLTALVGSYSVTEEIKSWLANMSGLSRLVTLTAITTTRRCRSGATTMLTPRRRDRKRRQRRGGLVSSTPVWPITAVWKFQHRYCVIGKSGRDVAIVGAVYRQGGWLDLMSLWRQTQRLNGENDRNGTLLGNRFILRSRWIRPAAQLTSVNHIWRRWQPWRGGISPVGWQLSTPVFYQFYDVRVNDRCLRRGVLSSAMETVTTV